jgi:hypothetical protein
MTGAPIRVSVGEAVNGCSPRSGSPPISATPATLLEVCNVLVIDCRSRSTGSIPESRSQPEFPSCDPFDKDNCELVREKAADRAFAKKIACDAAEYPLAQTAMAIGPGNQKVDALHVDDAEQLLRYVYCLQHQAGGRRNAVTAQIIHGIAHAVLGGFSLVFCADRYEEDLFGVMQER